MWEVHRYNVVSRAIWSFARGRKDDKIVQRAMCGATVDQHPISTRTQNLWPAPLADIIYLSRASY